MHPPLPPEPLRCCHPHAGASVRDAWGEGQEHASFASVCNRNTDFML